MNFHRVSFTVQVSVVVVALWIIFGMRCIRQNNNMANKLVQVKESNCQHMQNNNRVYRTNYTVTTRANRMLFVVSPTTTPTVLHFVITIGPERMENASFRRRHHPPPCRLCSRNQFSLLRALNISTPSIDGYFLQKFPQTLSGHRFSSVRVNI